MKGFKEFLGEEDGVAIIEIVWNWLIMPSQKGRAIPRTARLGNPGIL